MPKTFEYRYRGPRNTPEERGGKPPAYSRTLENEHAMIIERDVVMTLRDGTKLYADVFRPADERPVPPIIAWTPYGKHVPFDPQALPQRRREGRRHVEIHGVRGARSDVLDAQRLRRRDRRHRAAPGSRKAPRIFSRPRKRRISTISVEWAGTQPWSNGKVGFSGVSYLAQLQWRVAELNPPHLAAINPWEGWTDSYREVATHGGIPDTHFWPSLWNRWGASKDRSKTSKPRPRSIRCSMISGARRRRISPRSPRRPWWSRAGPTRACTRAARSRASSTSLRRRNS